MSSRVKITNIEDTRKLVNAWLKADARITHVSEDTEDDILWMTLESRLGRLQLRRDCRPLNLESPATDVWATLDKVPGSPYSVDDTSCMREDPAAVIAEHDRLWAKYWDPNWKRLDFLLAERESYPADLPSGAQILMWVAIALIVAALILASIILLVTVLL